MFGSIASMAFIRADYDFNRYYSGNGDSLPWSNMCSFWRSSARLQSHVINDHQVVKEGCNHSEMSEHFLRAELQIPAQRISNG